MIKYCLFFSSTFYLKLFFHVEYLMKYIKNLILPSQVVVIPDRLIHRKLLILVL